MPANSKAYSIATEILLRMQDCIDKNDKEGFLEQMERVLLNNCSCGDSYLQQYVQKVYANALEKFL